MRIGDEIIKVNGVELGHLQQTTTTTVNHALAFDSSGYIEIHIRVDDNLAVRRRFRSSCSALDETTKVQIVDKQQVGSKVFTLGSAPSDLDYVPVYAGNCKMIANQMSDDEKWQNLSKARSSMSVPVQDSSSSSSPPPPLIPKPMSLMTLSQSSPPLDDVALQKERLSMSSSHPAEGKGIGFNNNNIYQKIIHLPVQSNNSR